MNKSHPKRYIDLPLRQRRKTYISKRWRAKQSRDGRGVFFTHHLLPGHPEWESLDGQNTPNGHAEVRFVSQVHAKEGWWYHADFSSVPVAVIVYLADLVDKRVDQTIEDAGYSQDEAYPQYSWVHDSKTGLSTLKHTTYPRLERLGNKTIRELEQEAWDAIVPADYAHIKIGFRLSYDCTGAIDVFGVVPENHITLDNLLEIIQRFIENGEREVQFDTDLSMYQKEIDEMLIRQTEYLRQSVNWD